MNESSNLSATELIRRFGPKRPARFTALLPHRELIRELRGLKASYLTIHQALQFKGVQTSQSTIRKFCQLILQEPSVRPAKRRRKPVSPSRPSPHQSPTAGSEQRPPHTPHNQSPSTHRNSGPRIAKVEFLEPPKL